MILMGYGDGEERRPRGERNLMWVRMSWKNAIFTEIIVKGGSFNSIKEGKGVGADLVL
jgi:hypothetical protein